MWTNIWKNLPVQYVLKSFTNQLYSFHAYIHFVGLVYLHGSKLQKNVLIVEKQSLQHVKMFRCAISLKYS
jgi:hypothetical protein